MFVILKNVCVIAFDQIGQQTEESPLFELRRTPYLTLALLLFLQKQPYLDSEKFS